MTNSILDSLFNDNTKFIEYMLCNNNAKARKKLLITDRLRYLYCREIKDLQCVWREITNDKYLYKYCRDVKDRKYLWSKLRNNEWVANYCLHVKNRWQVSRHIKDCDILHAQLLME